MISIKIPNISTFEIQHLVLDYNGTLATDGKPIEGIVELIHELSQKLTIHIITADTFGTISNYFADINVGIKIISGEKQGEQKANFVKSLNAVSVVAIGNGANDALMLKSAELGIAVIQAEGASTQALINSDIACTSITDALNLLLNPLRIAATLRE